jgi:hypothetical protein
MGLIWLVPVAGIGAVVVAFLLAWDAGQAWTRCPGLL